MENNTDKQPVRDRTVVVRLYPDEHDAFSGLCRQQGRRVSDVMRGLILAYMRATVAADVDDEETEQ